ncbi:extracellular solute-binding protein [Paenibacillus sp. FSL P4-0184]
MEEGIYTVPQQPYAVLSFYNKDVYEKAGITKAPATWDEFSLVGNG